MLKCRLTHSIPLQGITGILHNPETQKLVVAKEDQSIKVYSRESSILKLIQTYPKLLPIPKTNDDIIQELYDCKSLSTIFARCNKSLLLFDSISLRKYDQIVDRRGIDQCWVMGTSLEDSDDTLTILVYATKSRSKLRMLIWEGRTYKRVIEAMLPNRRESLISCEADIRGVILATTHSIYHWPYGESPIRIDRIVKKKYPADLTGCLVELTGKTNDTQANGKSAMAMNDSNSVVSSSLLTRRSSLTAFWSRKEFSNDHAMKSIKCVFKRTDNNQIMIIDGSSQNLFQLCYKDDDKHELYLLATDLSQLLEWNRGLEFIKYLSGMCLILNNSHEIKFVDYLYGFTFLAQYVEQGIKRIEPIGASHFIVWTLDHQLQLYEYQVDNCADDSIMDDDSLCGVSFDTDFNKLWRKVVFYKAFLESPDRANLNSSNDLDGSLDLAVLKLRDLTVLWCLEIFSRFENSMNILTECHQVHKRTIVLEELIPKMIFSKFLEYWAPPQLIILRCFPPEIARLVPEVTGQKHACLFGDVRDQKHYILPAMVIRKCFLPYLTDTRRHLKNVSQRGHITWNHLGRRINADVNFFLMDKHQLVSVTTLLALIDTVLFMSYLYYYPSMVGPLLRIDNLCHSGIVVEELQKRRMFRELVDFYFVRNMHVDALGFLINLINDMDKQNNDIKFQDGVKVLMVDYLKKLPFMFETLIFCYTDWLLHRFGKDLLLLEAIFMNETPACASRNHYQIYEYIDMIDKATAVQYLEFVIGTLDSKDIKLHTTLIKLYFHDLNNPTTKMKLKSVLESTSIYEPRTILRLLNELLNNKRVLISKEELDFIAFLKTFPLQKLGEHNSAIDIYYDDLSDYTATSNYCERLYKNHCEIGEDSLNYFFQKVLHKYSMTSNFNEILYFLQEHGARINVINVYKCLPKELSLNQFKDVLLHTVKAHSISRDQMKLKKNLLQVELINRNNLLNKILSEYSILNENYKCPVCSKSFPSFTTDTLFLFTFERKKVIVHHNCGKTLQAKIQNKKFKAQQKAHRTVASLSCNDTEYNSAIP